MQGVGRALRYTQGESEWGDSGARLTQVEGPDEWGGSAGECVWVCVCVSGGRAEPSEARLQCAPQR